MSAILPGLLDAARIIHERLPGAQFVLARAPHLSDELFADLNARGPAIAMIADATDDVLAAADVALAGVGHGDRAGGAPRVPDGRRLSTVAVDLPSWPALRSREHVRDGQSRRGSSGRARS